MFIPRGSFSLKKKSKAGSLTEVQCGVERTVKSSETFPFDVSQLNTYTCLIFQCQEDQDLSDQHGNATLRMEKLLVLNPNSQSFEDGNVS